MPSALLDINPEIKQLFHIIQSLEHKTGRHFTMDGHLVGSIGEFCMAAMYDLTLVQASTKGYDALSKQGKKVEIKTTQKRRIAFRQDDRFEAELALVGVLEAEGNINVIYNGPISLIWNYFTDRAVRISSSGQYSIGVATLKKLDQLVQEEDQIPLKKLPVEDDFRTIVAAMTRDDFKWLLAFVERLPGIPAFALIRDGFEGEHGVSFPMYDEHPIVEGFRQEAYRIGIVVNFNWPDWNEGKALLEDSASDFTQLDLETLCKLVTVIIRNDRFCEGYLVSQFENGTICRILAAMETWFARKKV